MTNEEAIGYLDKVVIDEKFGIDSMIKASAIVNICKDALEKQIPKKPKCYEDKFIHCPSCGIGFGYKWECYPTKVNDYSHIQYCYGCGQRIDWGESK